MSTKPQVAKREKKDSLHTQQQDVLRALKIHELPVVFSEPFSQYKVKPTKTIKQRKEGCLTYMTFIKIRNRLECISSFL